MVPPVKKWLTKVGGSQGYHCSGSTQGTQKYQKKVKSMPTAWMSISFSEGRCVGPVNSVTVTQYLGNFTVNWFRKKWRKICLPLRSNSCKSQPLQAMLSVLVSNSIEIMKLRGVGKRACIFCPFSFQGIARPLEFRKLFYGLLFCRSYCWLFRIVHNFLEHALWSF